MTQFNNFSDLPQAEPEALALSQCLLDKIKTNIIRNGGVIGFDAYLRQALYEPGLGYYSAGQRKFGEAGDFVTAPEISPVFSRCLARQCQPILAQLVHSVIMELGAGTGIMAAEILLELQSLKQLPDAYWILEVSADLKERQQTFLKERVPFFFDKIQWLEQLPDSSYDGIILGNEIVDALPFKRFHKQDNTIFELGVSIVNDQLSWQQNEAADELLTGVSALEESLHTNIPNGFTSEINIELSAWLESIASKLNNGVMLLFDYGYPAKDYYHPQRHTGTLQCYYRHHVHDDPFYMPGLQDITASVDFTCLAEATHNIDLRVAGFTTQSSFLIANGLDDIINTLDNSNSKQQSINAQAIRTLTMPDEMGERIKVMALTRNCNIPLQGFTFMDQRARL